MTDKTSENYDARPKGRVIVRDISEIVEDACPVIKGDGFTKAYKGQNYDINPENPAASAAYKAKILPLAIKDVSTFSLLQKGA
jgi:hypothetical protein